MSKKKKVRDVSGEKEKIALEKQLVKEGKIFPRAHYAPRGRLRGIIALCLVFLLGILIGLGSVVGVGYYFGTRKLKDVFSLVGVDASNYLTETATEMSVVDLISEVATTPITSFNSLAQYTPVVNNVVEGLTEQLADLGVDLDADELMDVPFTELGEFFQDSLMSVELGKTLGLTPDGDPLMLALFYGKRDVDYRVEGGEIVMMEGKKPTLLGDLIDDASGLINRLTIGDIIAVSSDSAPIMQAIKDWTAADLGDSMHIERLRIKQVVDLGDSPSSLLAAIGDWRIGELSQQEKLDSLRLGDILSIDDNASGILRSISDFTIGSLDEGIQSLTLEQMLGEEAVSGNRILKHLAGSTVNTLSDDLSALSVGDVFGDQIFAYMSKGEDGSQSYQALADDYLAHYTEAGYNTDAHRPKAIANVTEMSSFHTYYTVGNTRVEQGYFLPSGNSFAPLPDGATVKFDSGIAHSNRTPNATWRTPWYYERKIPLTPAYGLSVVDYDAGMLNPCSENDYRFTNSGIIFTDKNGGEHLLEEDDYSLYYYDGEGKRIDFDRTILSYTDPTGVRYTKNAAGAWADANGNVIAIRSDKETGDYYLQRGEVFERYTDGSNYYEKADTTERYEYNEGGKTVELDRYVYGIWYLLLADETISDGHTTVKLNTDLPILQMDSIVTNVASKINDTLLAMLWFHEILNENPYIDLKVSIKIYTDRGDQMDTRGKYLNVTNLIEVTLSETISLVQGITELIPNVPFG